MSTLAIAFACLTWTSHGQSVNAAPSEPSKVLARLFGALVNPAAGFQTGFRTGSNLAANSFVAKHALRRSLPTRRSHSSREGSHAHWSSRRYPHLDEHESAVLINAVPQHGIMHDRSTVVCMQLADVSDGKAAAPLSSPRGIMIVDHGSRRATANDQLNEVVARYVNFLGADADTTIVEPAHMELASPTIGEAYDKLVEQGAESIVVVPFFLSRGRHFQEDIPDLLAEAAIRHPDTPWSLAEPLGLLDGMSELIHQGVVAAEGGMRSKPVS